MIDYKKYFPFQEIRPQQEIAIDFILNSYQNGKKIVVLEAGTGVGKSCIGITVARYLNDTQQPLANYLNGSYFLTTQKILQEQYSKDFGGSNGQLCSLKSSSNYLCNFNKELTCKESRHLLKGEPFGSQFSTNCLTECVYIKERETFLNALESITSYAYFLTSAQNQKTLKPRNLLVIDEAHNIENQVSNNYELSISQYFCSKILKIDWNDKAQNQQEVVEWVKEKYIVAVDEHIKHLTELFAKYRNIKDKTPQLSATAKQYDAFTKHKQKITTFISLYNEDNWAFNFVQPIGKQLKKFEFKPIDVSPYANEALFRYGHKSLLMSATILNKEAFCESLGLKNEDVDYLSLDTPFPEKNRPIFYIPAGKMSRENLDASLPKMVEKIKTILELHPNEKGIIHTNTFKIADYIKKNLKDKRLIFHSSDDRDLILEKHFKAKKASVLVSPSMTEGVDLKDDSSRFQILCKVPYPYLGDQVIKKRMKKFKHWYNYQTVKIVVQAFGRSIRHMDDSAVSYILDEDWDLFLRRNRKLFNSSFLRTIQNV